MDLRPLYNQSRDLETYLREQAEEDKKRAQMALEAFNKARSSALAQASSDTASEIVEGLGGNQNVLGDPETFRKYLASRMQGVEGRDKAAQFAFEQGQSLADKYRRELGGIASERVGRDLTLGELFQRGDKPKPGLGDVLGLGLQALPSLVALSSKDRKKNIKEADKKKALRKIKSLNLKEFEYKAGEGPSGKQVGIMTEDHPEYATPSKEGISGAGLYKLLAETIGAVQELSKEKNNG